MYKCPNCGAELRFDIKTQKLLCDHCSTTVDPYKYEQGGEAEKAEDGTYGVNVLRCPECGGEIISTSSAAAEFCSYCGASVVLESRLSREKKPESVIPFAAANSTQSANPSTILTGVLLKFARQCASLAETVSLALVMPASNAR